jgi:hypothetical protein
MYSLRFTRLRSAPKLALALFAALTSTSSAIGSTLWDWDYSGSGISASGTFTTDETPDANGGYLITAISGARNGVNITGLQAPGTWIPGNEPFAVDDLVFLGPGPQLTSHGFGFSTSDGNFSNPFYADFLPSPEYLEFFLPVQFSAIPVTTPEPATYALVLGAFTLALLRLRSRQRWSVDFLS